MLPRSTLVAVALGAMALLSSPQAIDAQSSAVGELRGSVRDSSGIAVSGLNLRLDPGGRNSVTDAGGAFRFPAVPVGRYTLIITGRGLSLREEGIDITEGAPRTLDLRVNLRAQSLLPVRTIVQQSTYTEPVTSFGSKTELPVLDIAQSTSSVSRAVLDDRQAIDIKESLRLVAGVNAGRSATTEFVIRGFNDNGSTTGFGSRGSIFQVNGLRNYLADYTSDVQLVNVERIEVLKGASGVLYGFNQPGGVINLVTKKPQIRPRYEISASGGSWARYRVTGDFTGPITDDGRLLYRFNVGLVSAPDFRDAFNHRTVTLAPSFSYQLDAQTRVDLDILHTQTDRLAWFDWGLPLRDANGDDVFDRISDQYSPHQQGDATRLTASGAVATIRREISPRSTWTTGITLSGNAVETQGHYPEFGLPAANGDVGLVYRNASSNSGGLFASNYLTTRFTTGSIGHQLVSGVDVFTGRGKTLEISATNTVALPNNVPATNLYTPTTAGFGPFGVPRLTRNYVFNDGYNSFERIGFVGAYVQDQITLSPKFKAMAGLRIDRHRVVPGQEVDAVTNTPVNPNLGLVFQPDQRTALFASYTQGFEPQLTQDPDAGGPFDPLYSRQLELGAKRFWFGQRLLTTASLFQLRRINQLVSAGDPGNPDLLVQAGEARSEGLELEMTGSLTSQWMIVANYSNTFARLFASDNNAIEGRPLPNAPRHLAAVWSKYTVAAGPLAGLGLGVGATMVGTRLGGFSFTEHAGYTTVDAALSWQVGDLAIAVNAYNLADRRYVSGIWSDFYAQRGMPRNGMIRITVPYGGR